MSETRSERVAQNVVAYIVLSIGLVIIMIPLIWMVSTALKDLQQVFRFPPTIIPDPVRWSNFREALTKDTLPFAAFYRNTIVITTVATIGAVTSSTVVAFSFSRLRWRGRDALFFLVIITMMIPREITLVPRFILFRSFGWIDSFLPLTVPEFFGNPFFIFLLRQYMLTVPVEIDQAATIDGCNEWQVMTRVIIPTSRVAILTVLIFSVQQTWNEFTDPLVFINTLSRFPISLGLAMFKGQYGTDYNLLMAASLLTMIPLIVLFAIFQRHFVDGVVVTGVKH